MIFTDTNNFVRFQPPAMSVSGDWYIRSVEQDYDFNWWYLTFDAPAGCPMLAKIFESYVLTTTSEDKAHQTLMDYYDYHGAPELYSAVGYGIVESQTMEFI